MHQVIQILAQATGVQRSIVRPARQRDIWDMQAEPVPEQQGVAGVTASLALHISVALTLTPPEKVVDKGRLHLLDSLAAIISGSRLPAGDRGRQLIAASGTGQECSLPGCGGLTSMTLAGLANGMAAHADETDDSHAPSLTHPGCAIVPAAIAAAERADCTGTDLLKAVILGYDISTRMAMALGGSRFSDTYHLSSHGWGGIFGATAAASALLGLTAQQVEHALSHAVQMASGNRCWLRDPDHVQKAYVFGGMPARGGLQATLMAECGITGAPQPLEGTPGLLMAFTQTSDVALVTAGLGFEFEIMRTSIKKWCVGSPIQAALDCIDGWIQNDGIAANDIEAVLVTLPAARAQVVNSAMPNINLRHLIALYLVDGGVTFRSVHDKARMTDLHVLAMAQRIRVAARPGAERAEQAEVTLKTHDGQTRVCRPLAVRGQPGNPMTESEVALKAKDLITSILGQSKSVNLIERMLRIEQVERVRDLRALWQG